MTLSIDQQKAILSVQKKVLESLALGNSETQVLDLLVRSAEQLSDGMLASVLALNDGNQSVWTLAAPSLPAEYNKAVDGYKIGPKAGSCGTAAYTGKMVIVENIAADPLWQDARSVAEEHGLKACWSSPIFSTGKKVL